MICFKSKQLGKPGFLVFIVFWITTRPQILVFSWLSNYAIVYVASIFGFEDLTVKFLEIDEYLQGSGFSD